MKLRECVLALSVTVAMPAQSLAQDANVALPVAEIEQMLRTEEFQVVSVVPSRGLPSERTYQITAGIGDAMLQMKYAPAAKGADEFNNRPRYELAAYELQKLFLNDDEFVVPPTVARCFSLDAVQTVLNMAPGDYKPQAEKTFDEWNMTLVLLQYWLWNVDVPEDLRDGDMLKDDVYARHMGNFNLVTYLIRHNDSNKGNFLRSTVAENPRVFSIDNGVAFSNEESDRGTYWRDLKLDRYPGSTIERLRDLTVDDLHAALGVVAQFELQGGAFLQTEAGENLDPGRGVRRDGTTIQLGLTESEVRQVFRRLERLLGWVDGGRYEIF